jgi:multiple antibiotic resistance protein
LLAILDPLAVIPAFLGAYSSSTAPERLRAARTAAIVVAVTLVVFSTVGARILAILGITIAAFRVAGGVILFLMALEMLGGSMSRVKRSESESRQDESIDYQSFAIVPLAIPLLAGPGAMSTAIVLGTTAPTTATFLCLYIVILLVSFITWTVLRLAVPAQRLFGPTGIRIATRIMGLLLASLAVQFMAGGLIELFPALGPTVAPMEAGGAH